jgi:hypothetical protein
MYWYGWLALAFPSAAVVAWIATLVSSKWLHRATMFCCVLAIVWSSVFMVGAGAAAGSRLPAVPVTGKNNISVTTATTIAVLTTYDTFLHMLHMVATSFWLMSIQ